MAKVSKKVTTKKGNKATEKEVTLGEGRVGRGRGRGRCTAARRAGRPARRAACAKAVSKSKKK